MRQAFLRFYHLYGRLMTFLAIAAGLTLFGLMWLVDANALARKLLNQPVTGTLEITEAAMPLVIMLPMAFTQLRQGHIRVAMLTDHLPMVAQRLLLLATLLIGFAFFAWVAWATGGYALRSYRINESAWGIIRFPIWPSKAGIALGALLLSVQFLLDFVYTMLGLDRDDDRDVVHGGGEVAHHG